MKKLITFVLCTIFAVCQTYAQTETDEMSQDLSNIQTEVSADSTAKDVIPELMHILAQRMQEQDTDIFDPMNPKITVPVRGKSAFAKSHLIYQELGISTIISKDKDPDSADDTDNRPQGQEKAFDSMAGLAKQLSLGLNVDYTLKFVPGKINGNNLELNRLGFAYSWGILAAFDSHNQYGITCDFMTKTGIETGNNHPLGVGMDFLFGTGKSSGAIYVINDRDGDGNDDGDDPEGYTAWCLKFGGQFWIKTNLLTTNLKNTDILAFARFVYSKNPDNEPDPEGIVSTWNEESWTFGITFRYRF